VPPHRCSENSLSASSSGGRNSASATFSGEGHTFSNIKPENTKEYGSAIPNSDFGTISNTSRLSSVDSGSTASLLPGNQQYVKDTLARLEAELSATIDREMVFAGSEMRKMRTPNVAGPDGDIKGTWKDSVFYLDDDYVPAYKNEDGMTIAEIKKDLYDTCGLTFDGIPFVDGAADFSSLSLASIPARDLVIQARGITQDEYDSLEPLERTDLFSQVFDKNRRETNFLIADRLTAEQQIPIPSLDPGYNADDLKAWRSDPKHRFTWDEQVRGGYALVPTIIHGNVPHTGLVSSSTRATEYFEMRKKDPPEKYSWKEDDAPISISEFQKKVFNGK